MSCSAPDPFPTFAQTPSRQRGEMLRRAFEIMIAEADDLARLVSRENGKVFADAKAEVLYAAEFFRWFSEEAVRIEGDFRTSPSGDKRIIAPFTASSISASSKTINGAFPPNSIEVRITRSAACFKRIFPT